MIRDLFLNYLRYAGVSKDEMVGFETQGHVQKSRNHRNEGFEGSPISKSKSYKFELEQNNTTELLSISSGNLPYTWDNNCQTDQTHAGFSGFSDFL